MSDLYRLYYYIQQSFAGLSPQTITDTPSYQGASEMVSLLIDTLQQTESHLNQAIENGYFDLYDTDRLIDDIQGTLLSKLAAYHGSHVTLIEHIAREYVRVDQFPQLQDIMNSLQEEAKARAISDLPEDDLSDLDDHPF